MRQFFTNCNALLTLTSSLLYLITLTSMAQISGVVTDTKTGKPLSGVEVFFNKTTFGAMSDETGQFTLENVMTGFLEIVVYKNGYSVYKSSMKVQSGRSYNLKLSLTATKRRKTTKPSKEETALVRTKLIKSENQFITIVNEEDIEINDDTEGQRLLSSKTPLILQNEATGYRLKVYVMGIALEELDQSTHQFEFLPAADMRQNISWEKNRKKNFEGSQRHWLMALVADRLKEEGYILQDEKQNEVDAKSVVSFSPLAGYSKLSISQPLNVLFKNENGSIETSRVITSIPVDVNAAGLPINSKALRAEGDMANAGLANQLPIDYQPIAGDIENTYAQTIESFYEKVYVHTDKPYYYPGEPMWFKGYIHYKESKWRDSLSRVMYVELINPKKEVTLAKTLKIDSGFFHNDFILPDTLQAGTYYLRAYTNLGRNFGDSNLFVKPIPILNITDKVDHTQGKMEATENSLLSITSDKKTYKTREKITLTLSVKDKEGNPLAANLSLSVTDVVQVVPITEPLTILNGHSFRIEKQKKTIELKYPVEYGVSFKGKFLNDNGKPEKTTLTILQMKPRNMMLATSDEQGIFSVAGLDFYDTATFAFKADKAKDYPYGKVELLPREMTPMNFKTSSFDLAVQNTQSPQRIISEYEVPKDVRLLESVEVKASRIEKPVDRFQRPYGTGDYVMREKEIKKEHPNLLYSLAGAKTGGIYVDPINKVIYFTRAGAQSINFGSGPVVTINNVPIGGVSAGEILSSIDPSNVESIELTKRINVLYGSQGANGVIAIYTKQGISEEALKVDPNFQAVKISGYSLSRNFKFPNYESKGTDTSKTDYRSTIYWNPEVAIGGETGTAMVSIFAADLPGKYRIVAEGVNENGEPVRCVYFVEIESE